MATGTPTDMGPMARLSEFIVAAQVVRVQENREIKRRQAAESAELLVRPESMSVL
jgi:hypothetical protein